MSRRRSSRRLVVPESRQGMEWLKAEVMRREGYNVNSKAPDDVKYEVANRLGVSLDKGYNGHITAENAGRIGGQIGGAMVREMIRMAQQTVANQRR